MIWIDKCISVPRESDHLQKQENEEEQKEKLVF